MFPAPIPRLIPADHNIWKKEAIFSVTPSSWSCLCGRREEDTGNNCFIIRSPSFLMNILAWEAKRSAIFKQERSQEGEKHGFLYA